jgi:hypothetical protein
MSGYSDTFLVLEAHGPPRTGPYAEHFERFARPHALAEIQRRGLDVEAVVRRIRALMVEMRKLSDEDLEFLEFDTDDMGMWRMAEAVRDGTDPLPTFPATGIRAGRSHLSRSSAGPVSTRKARNPVPTRGDSRA